jgi:hypothetical protein
MVSVIEVDTSVTVEVVETTVRVEGVPGPRGPMGPAGPSAGGLVLTASGALGGHRLLVALGAGLAGTADPGNPAHVGQVVGMSNAAAADGTAVTVIQVGEIVEPSWAWSPGPVYLGAVGVPTQTRPTTGFLQEIGVATGPTRLVMDLKMPIQLN